MTADWSVSVATKNDTRTTTTTKAAAARSTMTETAVVNDGCGLDATRNSVHWNPVVAVVDRAPSSPNSSSSSSSNNSSLHYMQQVYECAKRFKWSYAADTDNDTDNQTNNNPWQELVCQQQQQSIMITHKTVRSIIRQHDTILLAGDSVMRQQYFVLLCMVEPDIQVLDMSLYNPRDRKKARYEFQHSKHDGGSGNMTTKSTTTLFYVPYGYIWQAEERNLYQEAVPYAIRTYTNQSVIVLDSSRHYDSTRGHLLQKAVTFIAQQTMQTNASVYYMEPTPEEWPTSNGMFTAACHGVCTCQVLTDAQLQGRGLTIQDVAATTTTTSSGNVVSSSRNNFVDIQQDVGKLPMPSSDVFGKLYPDLLSFLPNDNDKNDNDNAKKSNQSSHLLCIPDCLPATWRMDLVRYTLQQHAKQNPNNNNNNNKKVQLVPNFWQLAARNRPSSRKSVGDCTHRSFDALFMMNQQLIRSMMMR